MTWRVVLHKQANKNLEKFSDSERIRESLRHLTQFPDVKNMLRIEDNLYRLRIGEYRALFKVYDTEHMIVVLNIDVRGKIYKGL